MRKGKLLAGVLSTALVLGGLTLPTGVSFGDLGLGTLFAEATDEVASGTCGTNAKWSLDSEGTLTVSGSGKMDAGQPWSSYKDDIISVVIEDGITNVGAYAFRYCYYLTSVDIPDSVTSIDGYAFYYCSNLESMELPDSVATLGTSAFGESETELIYSDTSPLNGGSVTLYGIDSLYEDFVTIPSNYIDTYQIQGDITSCKLVGGKSVEVSEDGYIELAYETWYQGSSFASTAYIAGATVIYAIFSSPSYIEVTTSTDKYYFRVDVVDYGEVCLDKVIDDFISANITDDMTDLELMETICSLPASYNYDATYGSAKGMVLSGGGDCIASTDLILQVCEKLGINAWSRSAYNDTGAGSGHVNAIAELNGLYYVLEAGYNEEAPRTYTVTERTTLFSTRSVEGGVEVYQYDGVIDGPYELIIPEEIEGETVVSIGRHFAYGETNLTKITIPDTVTSIGIRAFSDCTSLTTLNIPASVQEIGNYAFSNCTALTSFTCDSDSQYFTIEDGVLYNKSKTVAYAAPAVSSVKLADTVEGFGVGAFSENTYLTEIEIPSSVTSIDIGVFYGCSNLVSVGLPDTVTTILDSAFANCTSLTDITLPDSLETIDIYAFYRCSGLTDINFPIDLESIGDYAFYGCTELTSVSLPEGLTSVGFLAFAECDGLTEINLPSTLTTIGQGAFYECTGLKSLVIPEGVECIDVGAFYGCTSLTNLTIADSVETIERAAFEGCTSLSSVIIPDTVTSIGDVAFGYKLVYNSTTGDYDDVKIDDFVICGYTGTAAQTYAEENDFTFVDLDNLLMGDINLDGDVDYLDAMTALRYDAELINLTDVQLSVGDVNGDGSVNSLDAILILRYDAGLISYFSRDGEITHHN